MDGELEEKLIKAVSETISETELKTDKHIDDLLNDFSKHVGENGKSILHEVKIPEQEKFPEEFFTTYSRNRRRWGHINMHIRPMEHRFLTYWANKQGYKTIESFLRKILRDILIENNVGLSRFIDDKYKDYKIAYKGVILDD